MTESEDFHPGEVAVQQRTGQREMAMRNAAVIGSRIRGGAVPFLAEQRFVVIGGTDEDERMWASMIFGDKGFASSTDGTTVVIDRSAAHETGHSAIDALTVGTQLGMLAIDLGTRRRLRVNGMIDEVSDDRVLIGVREAYPNCPKYIHRRHVGDFGATASSAVARYGDSLDDECGRLLSRADTFFVATGHTGRGVDVSHRGGLPGFIDLVDHSTLRIPDYSGNSMYNTLGNLMLEDRAGLSVPDFATGSMLQLTGHASVLFDQPEDPGHPTGGTGRYWEFRVEQWKTSTLPAAQAWELLDYSPSCPLGAGEPRS